MYTIFWRLRCGRRRSEGPGSGSDTTSMCFLTGRRSVRSSWVDTDGVNSALELMEEDLEAFLTRVIERRLCTCLGGGGVSGTMDSLCRLLVVERELETDLALGFDRIRSLSSSSSSYRLRLLLLRSVAVTERATLRDGRGIGS